MSKRRMSTDIAVIAVAACAVFMLVQYIDVMATLLRMLKQKEREDREQEEVMDDVIEKMCDGDDWDYFRNAIYPNRKS